MRRRSGGRTRCARVSRRISPSTTMRPVAEGRRPAIDSSSDVFPEPEAPRTATARPESVLSTRSVNPARGSVSSSSIMRTPTRAFRRVMTSVVHTVAKAITTVTATSRSALSSCPICVRWKIASAMRLRAARDVAGDQDRGAELAEGPREGEQRPRQDAAPRQRAASPAGTPANGELPSERAIPSRRGSTSSNADRTGRTRSGKDMTAVASTTAFQVKRISTAGAIEEPSERAATCGAPRAEAGRPRSAASTSGRLRIVSARVRPAPARRARSQAAPTAIGRMRRVEIAATRSVSSRIEASLGTTLFQRRGRGSRASRTSARPASPWRNFTKASAASRFFEPASGATT